MPDEDFRSGRVLYIPWHRIASLECVVWIRPQPTTCNQHTELVKTTHTKFFSAPRLGSGSDCGDQELGLVLVNSLPALGARYPEPIPHGDIGNGLGVMLISADSRATDINFSGSIFNKISLKYRCRKWMLFRLSRSITSKLN